ncbi:MAG: hypothetical protein R2939_19820 [Kofleriaceae bacterium]
MPSRCGDGYLNNEVEYRDDGNHNDNDACDSLCRCTGPMACSLS